MSGVSRAERYQQVMELRARGLNNREIALQLGIAHSTVNNLIADPDGSKDRARKARYAGVCADCGGPTSGGDGPAKAPLRCRWCAQGRQRPRNAIRLCVPVRLSDLPLDVRLKAAEDANRRERDEAERLEILLAAIEPSDRVYWVAESARPLLEQIAA